MISQADGALTQRRSADKEGRAARAARAARGPSMAPCESGVRPGESLCRAGTGTASVWAQNPRFHTLVLVRRSILQLALSCCIPAAGEKLTTWERMPPPMQRRRRAAIQRDSALPGAQPDLDFIIS